MSSQILKVVAAVMLIGSVILIVIAYRLSQSPQSSEATTSVKVPEKTYSIVTVTRSIQSGEILREGDVVLTPFAERPADAFDATAEVLGKRLVNTIAQSKPLLRGDLATVNVMAQSLKPNERAIAIKVDEFIGVGGFIQPGDSVDVTAFIRGDNQQVKESQAVVVLHGVRILSYGEELPANTEDKDKSKDEALKGKTGRKTAVVAIDVEQTPLIALVENAAVVRLALRPVGAVESENLFSSITLSDIAAQPKENVIPDKPKGPLVEIYHGTQVEQVQYP